MVDMPAEPDGDLDAEIEEIEDDLADLDDEVRGLIDAFRDRESGLRLAVRYTGDESDLLFVRDDIRERYSDPELQERIDALIVKGLGDPPREESLYDFGRLDATIRWYDAVLVVYFPYREWSGLVFTFDRRESPIVDIATEHLGP